MAYAYTVTTPIPVNIGGGLRISMGTFTDAASAGSAVVTGLNKVHFCAAMGATAAMIMGCTESGTDGTITLLATNDGTDDGLWVAIGV